MLFTPELTHPLISLYRRTTITGTQHKEIQNNKKWNDRYDIIFNANLNNSHHIHYGDVIMSVSYHQTNDCLLNRLFRRKSTITSKHRVTGLCTGNSSVTGAFPIQRTSNAKNVSIWWCNNATRKYLKTILYFRIFEETLDCYREALQGCSEEELVERGVHGTWVALQELVESHCSSWI